jgi:hypothetical protein
MYRARHCFAVAVLVAVPIALLTPAASPATDLSESSIDEARQALASSYYGPAPLFFTQQAVDAVPLTIQSVDGTTGDGYGATAFYDALDGGDSNGQLWMQRSPAQNPESSFGSGSCGDRPIVGPRQLGPYTTYYAACDISFMYRFVWEGRLYTVASKYYGGLDADQLAAIVAAMTPVATGTRALPRKVVLGSSAFAPSGRGFGKEKPSAVFNGGVPSGFARSLRWRNWGSAVSYGRGLIPIYKPKGGYYPKLATVELRASKLSQCPGEDRRAYTYLQARVPKKPGGKLGRWFAWAGAKNICESLADQFG